MNIGDSQERLMPVLKFGKDLSSRQILLMHLISMRPNPIHPKVRLVMMRKEMY